MMIWEYIVDYEAKKYPNYDRDYPAYKKDSPYKGLPDHPNVILHFMKIKTVILLVLFFFDLMGSHSKRAFRKVKQIMGNMAKI
ncbi:hypothetical protein [Candidatus Protochlamydia phocaeensis]|uniref:hypothetical protein n=1 Tax=Candidatus Protochlamydia phocaeensis TaxID=1414722 RepID=UPI000A76F332|nr:hypothetical protein [Candidatus Protochlamydia phocaeensis]